MIEQLVQAIRAFVLGHGTKWEGTYTALLDLLNLDAQHEWPLLGR